MGCNQDTHGTLAPADSPACAIRSNGRTANCGCAFSLEEPPQPYAALAPTCFQQTSTGADHPHSSNSSRKDKREPPWIVVEPCIGAYPVLQRVVEAVR